LQRLEFARIPLANSFEKGEKKLRTRKQKQKEKKEGHKRNKRMRKKRVLALFRL